MEHQFSFLLIFFLQTSLGSGEMSFYQKTSFFKVLVALSPLTLLWEFWKIHRSQPFPSSRLLIHPTSQYLPEYNLIRSLVTTNTNLWNISLLNELFPLEVVKGKKKFNFPHLQNFFSFGVSLHDKDIHLQIILPHYKYL